MMLRSLVAAAVGLFLSQGAAALSFAPEEFLASRQMACVLAQQSLGQLTDDAYGERTHDLLDGYDAEEQDQILANALGYYDGLMFEVDPGDDIEVARRLERFVSSDSCRSDSLRRTVSL